MNTYKKSTTLRDGSELSFEVDASKDYFRIIEQLLPSWLPVATQDPTGRSIIADVDKQASPMRLLNMRGPDGKIYEFNMPHQRYARAVDPAGNLVPLTVNTCQIPDDDNTGFEDKTKGIKRRSGWFIAEPDEEFNGLTGQEYGAFIFAVMKHRQALHAEKQANDARAFQSQAEKTAIELAQKHTDQINNVLDRQGQNSEKMIEDLVNRLTDKQGEATEKLLVKMFEMLAAKQGKAKHGVE